MSNEALDECAGPPKKRTPTGDFEEGDSVEEGDAMEEGGDPVGVQERRAGNDFDLSNGKAGQYLSAYLPHSARSSSSHNGRLTMVMSQSSWTPGFSAGDFTDTDDFTDATEKIHGTAAPSH